MITNLGNCVWCEHQLIIDSGGSFGHAVFWATGEVWYQGVQKCSCGCESPETTNMYLKKMFDTIMQRLDVIGKSSNIDEDEELKEVRKWRFG